jgi:hypothetical protein
MTRRAALPVVVGTLGALAAAVPLASAAGGAGPSAWATAANAICSKAGDRIQDVPRGSSLAEIAKGTQKVLGIILRQNGDLAKLPRPARDAASIATLLGYYAQQADVVRGIIVGLKKGDQGAANAMIAKGDAVNTKATALARKLGATDC